MPERKDHDLGEQVSRMRRLDEPLLNRVREEVLSRPAGWVADSGEYQSGGWWSLALLNSTGKADDVEIRDCTPTATDLLRRMPATGELIASLGLRFQSARLARLDPGAFLWEHRDYRRLDSSERYRLHIPIVTNPEAVLVTGGARIHLREGHLWRLAPRHAHGAGNLGEVERVHLILDCRADAALGRLRAAEELTSQDIERLPPMPDAERADHLATAKAISADEGDPAAERYLLQQYFHYALPEGAVYELVAAFHDVLGRSAAAEKWRGVGAARLARSV